MLSSEVAGVISSDSAIFFHTGKITMLLKAMNMILIVLLRTSAKLCQ